MAIFNALISLPLKDFITLFLSTASFLFSLYALWIAQFNHGRLKMTQPNLLSIMRDLPAGDPKIFLRTLLFTTGTKGRVIQSMFLKVHDRNGSHLLGMWGHTEAGKLTLGSGLYVGPIGIACDHHFNPRRGVDNFNYVDGSHRIEIFAALVGQATPRKLMEVSFTLGGWELGQIIETDARLDLLWNAETRTYDQHIEESARSGVSRPSDMIARCLPVQPC